MKRTMLLGLVAVTALSSVPVDAQTTRAEQRRAERNARQLQRQVNRSDYYAPQTWQQLDPWIQQNGVRPLARAARAVGDTVDAVGDAVAQTVDAATARGDGQFGYRDKNPQNAWFYDYYSYTPTYYTQPSDDRYAGAIRYFDADNDGVFDSQSYYRDSDADGQFDEYDRFDFFTPSGQAEEVQAGTEVRRDDNGRSGIERDAYHGPRDARRHKVQGEIAFTKTAEVNGQQNLVVGIDQDQTQAIDLGPAESLQGKGVEVGSQITATGTLEMIGDKQLLIADRFQIEGSGALEIERANGLNLSGQIVDVKQTTIGSTEHALAVVQIDGERQLVDLGPAKDYKNLLQPNTQITIRGVPVRAQNHRVIMADQVRVNGEVFTIQRMQSILNK